MGDPRKQKRKFAKPKHLWKVSRIEEENALTKEYGLKNKREIWRARSRLRGFRQQARSLLAATGESAEKEKKELAGKLNRLGILEGKNFDDVLGLEVKNILERRLQTLTVKKGLASTPKQARQLIAHKHVRVGGRVMNTPGYLVPKAHEDLIALDETYAKKVAK
ncbi:MAG TPA: 30S ribosomal protein S4 [Candidatus Altiarchaeales archaeon]|mgnify:CR=1 FL=1|nr:30S ribosomal protein S4 [Candidatus Altiarchaeales archaeon]